MSVIQVYSPTTDGKEDEVDQFYEDLEDLLEHAESQRIARRDQKPFFNGQYKEIEENNRKGKTRDFFQRRQWNPTPVLLHGKSHGWRSLIGYSPWGRQVVHWFVALPHWK